MCAIAGWYRRNDRASMAHSVEARVLFLSHKMVDWVLAVAEEFKLRGRIGKLILRRAIAPLLPQEIQKRPKRGFQIPTAHWLRGRFGDFARAIWYASGIAEAGYVDRASAERLFREHQECAADHSRMFYAIRAFGIWWSEAQSASPAAQFHAR